MDLVAVQFDMAWEDKPANHQRVEALLAAAAPRPQSLIVLPEMFDTGFSMNPAVTAQSEDRESEAFLRFLAAEHQSAVLGGVVGPLSGEQACNEAVAFAPDGSELVRYRKMQPFSLAKEEVHFGAGNQSMVFSWEGLTVAPFICYDLRFPEVFRPAAVAGARRVMRHCQLARATIGTLGATAASSRHRELGICRRRQSLPATILSCPYDGRSVAFDPHGVVLSELDESEQVVCWELQPEVVREWRAAFPALRDARHL